jgi:biotin transport system substrate-specific component
MTNPSSQPIACRLLPNDGVLRLVSQIGLVMLGTLVIALSAKIKVPLGPVDMSMQTLAILVIAGFFGRKLAVLTILLYLAEGLAGLPVFQGTPEKGVGLAYMVGPTAGYLAGFIAMAAITGWAVDQGYARRPVMLLMAMLTAEIAMLAGGMLWLAILFGLERAFMLGVGPFILTDLVKVVLAAAILAAATGRTARARK